MVTIILGNRMPTFFFLGRWAKPTLRLTVYETGCPVKGSLPLPDCEADEVPGIWFAPVAVSYVHVFDMFQVVVSVPAGPVSTFFPCTPSEPDPVTEVIVAVDGDPGGGSVPESVLITVRSSNWVLTNLTEFTARVPTVSMSDPLTVSQSSIC